MKVVYVWQHTNAQMSIVIESAGEFIVQLCEWTRLEDNEVYVVIETKYSTQQEAVASISK